MQVSTAGPSRGRAAMNRSWGVATSGLLGALLTVTAHAAVLYRGNQPVELAVDADRVVVEIDGGTAGFTALAEAARLGFTGARPIPYASRAGRVAYALPVGDTGSGTLALLRSVPGIRAARRLYRFPGTDSYLVPDDRIVVMPKPGVTDAEVRALLASRGCEVLRTMGIGVKMYVVRLTDETLTDTVAVAARLAGSGVVTFAQPNFAAEKKKYQVDDPLFVDQWHLLNRGQTGGLVGADIKAEGAWEITLGEGAVVAILDDAVDWQHPDIIDNVVARYDFVNGDEDPSPFQTPGFVCVVNCDQDDPGEWQICHYCQLFPEDSFCHNVHGTATTGLAVARANDIGVRGVAPMAGVVAEAMLAGTDIDTADAFYYAETQGAFVASNSWGYVIPGYIPLVVQTAIEDISRNGRGGKGVLVMFASGNGATRIDKDGALATMPEVMAIGATLKNDRLTCYSSFGQWQSVVAPGGGLATASCFEPDMTTTDVTQVPVEQMWLYYLDSDSGQLVPIPEWGWCPPFPDFIWGYNPPPPPSLGAILDDLDDTSYTKRFSGTSAACPVAAGVAALVFSVDPTLTATQVRNIIEHTADKVHTVDGGYDPVTGHSDQYGHGRVNAERAVRAAAMGRVWPSPVSDVADASVADQVSFTWVNPPEDVETILIVRSVGPLTFAPVDGIEYVVGEQVAPSTIVVSNDLRTAYSESNAPDGDVNYGIFVKSPNVMYSWGRRVQHESKSVPEAPAASVSASPTAGAAPLTVRFYGGGYDPQSRQITLYRWTFGDGETGTGATVEHTYTAPGDYLAQLTITNTVGLSGTASILIEVDEPSNGIPGAFRAVLSSSASSGSAPLSVTFTAGVVPATTSVREYAWDFGDGTRTTTTTSSVTHTYSLPGTYTASVTVTDSLGTYSRASTTVTGTGGDGQAARDVTEEPTAPLPCGAGALQMMGMAALTLMGVRRTRARDRRL